MHKALDIAGAECVTVAVRRERLINAQGRNLLEFVDTSRNTILPNTAGCFTAEDAVRVARLGREILSQMNNPGDDWVKLEVLGDKQKLLPDPWPRSRPPRSWWPRFPGAGLHQRRSRDGPAAERGGGGQRDARRQPHRLGPGGLNPNAIRICLEYLKDGDPAIR